jgi:transposase-like protein
MPRGPNYQGPYPEEFKRGALELFRTSGRPQEQVARELRVSTESLRLWREVAHLAHRRGAATCRAPCKSAERRECDGPFPRELGGSPQDASFVPSTPDAY